MPAASGADAPVTLRGDARRNRERILDAAGELFAARGLDVPTAAIARRAGVGVATLYRRFPTKESLVVAVFAGQFAACVAVVDTALDDPDPWRGFRTVIEYVCLTQARDRGFGAALAAALRDTIDVERERGEAIRGFAELTRRAQASGRLRADFTPADLTLVLMANGGIVADSAEIREAASRRLVAYLIEGFRADRGEPAAPLPPAAPLRLRDVVR